MTTRECPRCRARNDESNRRCRICTLVIRTDLPDLPKGLSALRDGDRQAWVPGEGLMSAMRVSSSAGIAEAPQPEPRHAPDSVGGKVQPPWGTGFVVDDAEAVAIAAIVVDAPPHTRPTPPPSLPADAFFDPDVLVEEWLISEDELNRALQDH